MNNNKNIIKKIDNIVNFLIVFCLGILLGSAVMCCQIPKIIEIYNQSYINKELRINVNPPSYLFKKDTINNLDNIIKIE